MTGFLPLLGAWPRADQGSAVTGGEDPRLSPGAVHAEVTAGDGAGLQLRHLPGGSPGEPPLPAPTPTEDRHRRPGGTSGKEGRALGLGRAGSKDPLTTPVSLC